jgi:16S rRNA (adenine1518-N6/adenine1519-N6)-dimethyltransferase
MPAHGKRRALGQHFLRDKSIAHLIAETACTAAREHHCTALLEIGPGRGAITDPILELRGDLPLTLCERDRELADAWKTKATAHAKLEVVSGDFLEAPEETWLSRTPLAVASNLPYSAGTAILNRLARHRKQIPVMVLMFQAEVAQRLRAEPNTKSWGSLSVWLQNDWDVKKLCAVPPRAFAPPPDVDSEVVVLTRRDSSRIVVEDNAHAKTLWESLLRVCFAHRRKMLRSGLPPNSPYRKALDTANIDGTKRAESLSWEEWDRLYRALATS